MIVKNIDISKRLKICVIIDFHDIGLCFYVVRVYELFDITLQILGFRITFFIKIKEC